MPRVRNLLFMHSGGDCLRGSENVVLQILQGLDRGIFRPFVICDKNVLKKAVDDLGIDVQVRNIPEVMIDRGYWKVQFIASVRMFLFLIKFCRRNNIELIYSNGGLPAQTAYYAARILRIPIITHVHCGHTLRYILLYNINRSSRTVFVSHYTMTQNLAKTRFAGVCDVVYNGVDVSRFSPSPEIDDSYRRSIGIDPDAIVIGQVGSIEYAKGIDVLLRAFGMLCTTYKSIHLVLIGSGPDEASFRALSHELGCADKVTFSGQVGDVTSYYRHVLDIMVLASRGEGLPLTLIEASASGLPCIGTKVGGVAEIIRDHESGFIVEPGDVGALADRCAVLVESESLRMEMGKAGRCIAKEKFSAESFTGAMNEILSCETGVKRQGQSRESDRPLLPP